MTKQTITRKGSFDSGHRVMNERMKCFNIHGHTYIYELTFEFNEMEEIGYAIDFKEIKRVGCQWIDDLLDHGFIVNPKDEAVINACKLTTSKIWYMSLNGKDEYCNPSAENIAKERQAQLAPQRQNYQRLTTQFGGDVSNITDPFEAALSKIPEVKAQPTDVRSLALEELKRRRGQ